MPKTKEQKQQEALQRAAVNFYRTTLTEFIATMPGGGGFNSKEFSRNALDNCCARFDALMHQAKKYGVKLPIPADLLYKPSWFILDAVVTRLWIGQIVDIYARELEKHTGELGWPTVETLLNDAGKAREQGAFALIGGEVGLLKKAIDRCFFSKSK